MLRINESALTIIVSDMDTSHDAREIIVDKERNCPSTIGLKNYNEYKDFTGRTTCDYRCHSCWCDSLKYAEDFVIKWKYKGSDEYV